MKKMILSISLIAALAGSAHAQNTFPNNGSAGIGTNSPNAAALLEMVSTSKGLLIPRMTKNQRDDIATPPEGLIIYQTNSTAGFYYYTGSSWNPLVSKGPNKSLSNLDATAINQSLIPGSTNTLSLGSSALKWNELYINSIKFADGTSLSTAAGAETDPQVGANTTSFIPRWDGAALVKGLIQDNGSKIGINKAPDSEHRLGVMRQGTTGSIFQNMYSAIRGDNNVAGSTTLSSVGYLGVNNPGGLYPFNFPNFDIEDIGVLGVKLSGVTTEGAGVFAWNSAVATNNYGVYAAANGGSGNKYGVYATAYGGGAVNRAIYAKASGAALNYALIVPEDGGNSGFGWVSPSAILGAKANGTDDVFKIISTGFITKFLVDKTGNVAVNTSTPAPNYELSVNGDIYASSQISVGTTSANAVVNISGADKTIEVDGTNPYIQMKSVGNDVGYLRAKVSNLEIGTNSGNVGNLSFNTNGTERMIVGSNGRVGINTIITPAQFNVVGTNETVNINGTNPYLQMNNASNRIGFIRASGNNFQVATNSENTTGKLEFRTKGSSRMWIDANGNVTVGGSGAVANGYLFNVDGKMIAEEVRVELNDPWPDYVFQNDYELMDIKDLKKFVTENNHLPQIPSAAEMKDGVDLGKMNTLLMQKVEELTLYIIKLNEEVEQLKKAKK